MSELFPETVPSEIEITAPEHIIRIGEWHGLAAACQVLKDVPESKRPPGFGYALALLEREEAQARASLLHKNLLAAARAGMNLAQVRSLGFHGTKLIITPYAPGEAMEP